MTPSKSKLIPRIIIILLIILAIPVCSLIFRRLEHNRAEKNAVNYIEKKYGFTPEIINSKRYYDVKYNFDIVISRTKTPTDKYRIKMKHGDREFTVYIPYTHVTDEGEDDYQSSEIAAAVDEKVSSYFDGKVMTIDNSGHPRIGYSYSSGEYYDGTNIDSFLHKDGCYYIYTVGSNLDELDLDMMLKELKAAEIFVFDLRSEDAYKELYESEPFSIVEPEIGSVTLEPSLPFLDEFAMQRGSKKEYVKTELKSFDDFLYGSSSNNNIEITGIGDISLDKWDIQSLAGRKAPGYAVKTDKRFNIYLYRGNSAENGHKYRLLYSFIDKNGERKYSEAHDFSAYNFPHSMFSIYENELESLEFTIIESIK